MHPSTLQQMSEEYLEEHNEFKVLTWRPPSPDLDPMGTSVGRSGPALNSENLKKTCFGRKWGLHNSWQVFVMLWLIGVKIAAKVTRKICDLDDFWSRWQLRIWRKITHRALRSKKNIFSTNNQPTFILFSVV